MDTAKAEMHQGDMASSAKSCYAEACRIMDGQWMAHKPNADKCQNAASWALRSLAYSVGVFSATYAMMASLANEL